MNMVPSKISSFLLFLFFATSLFAEEDKSHWCDLALGDWRGVYELDGRPIYQFDSALDEDGSIIVDFYYFDSDTSDRQEGNWLCEYDIIETEMKTGIGGTIVYRYQIMDIDKESMSYEMISPQGIFHTFHSKRVGARSMKSELLNP